MTALDIRTAMVLLVVSTALMALTLAAGRTGSARGFAKWNIGLGLIAGAWLLIAARASLPALAGKALADAMMVAGLCMQVAALIEFDGRPAPRWLQLCPGPLLFAATLPVLHDYARFTVLVSSAFSLALFALAARCLKARTGGARAARWMMAVFYIAGGLALAARAAAIWLAPAAHPDIFATDLLQSMTFLLLFALTLTGSVGFLVLHRAQAEAEIRHLAMHDPMTELLNRRAFMQLAERELARARRAPSASFALLMMDLDYFKRVNDRYGHQTGDRVLAEFGAAAKRCVRTEDLVGRYGGEEFCALLPGATPAAAAAIAERIRAGVAAQPLGALPEAVTVSIGVAHCSAPPDCGLDAIIAAADAALYRAKGSGRNRVVAEAFRPAGPG